MVTGEPMSEFKFACPVCGQHITADSSTSGGHIECPTCFQKIVVPQAPASAETKFILSASQVGKPRPSGMDTTALPAGAPGSGKRLALPITVAVLVVLCAAGAGLFLFRDRLPAVIGLGPRGGWSLDLKQAKFPETAAAGKLLGHPFTSERAALDGTTLSLREGRAAPQDFGVAIQLGRRWGREPAGTTVEFTPDQRSPVPHIVVSWRDEQHHPSRQVFTNGYALRLAFDQIADERLPGRIYLCLPDEAKSVVAGTFDAAVRKPKGPPPQGPKPSS